MRRLTCGQKEKLKGDEFKTKSGRLKIARVGTELMPPFHFGLAGRCAPLLSLVPRSCVRPMLRCDQHSLVRTTSRRVPLLKVRLRLCIYAGGHHVKMGFCSEGRWRLVIPPPTRLMTAEAGDHST